MKKKIVALVCILTILCANVLMASAAVGNHSGHAATGGTTGGSTHTYVGGTTGGSTSGSGVGGIGAGGIVVVIVVAVILYALQRKGANLGKNAGFPNTSVPPAPPVSNMSEHDIEVTLNQHDPEFSSEKFIAWSSEVFITLQQAWTKKDWKAIRPFEAEPLFRQHQMQLQEYIDQKKTNIISNICITGSYLSNYEVNGDYEYLTVHMSVNMNDYIRDDESGNILERNPNEKYYSDYDLVYMRTLGVMTNAEKSNRSTTNCPNCGAPTQITSAGECEYCHSVITTGDHDWVLCQLNCNE